MPTHIQIAIWNVNCGLNGNKLTTLKNMTGQMDHQNRYRLLKDVVAAASDRMAPPDRADGTDYLRLFLAPEYLFAESHEKHITDYETRTHVLDDLSALSRTYADIIFFPGTIAFCKALIAKDKNRQDKYKQLPNIANFSPKKVFIAHNTAYVFHNLKRIYKYHKRENAGEVSPDENRGGHLIFAGGDRPNSFTYQNLTFGIEVCADHAAGHLRHCGQVVDIHIILSASTGFIKTNTTVREGGIVCHADADLKPAVYQKLNGEMEEQPTAREVGIANDPQTNTRIIKMRKTVEKKLVSEAKKNFAVLKETNKSVYTKSINAQVTKFREIMGGRLGIFECMI